MTPEELRTLAWKTLPCRYKPCSQPAGRRCITASGERTTPHAVRVSDITMWQQGFDSREAEVAALVTERGDLRAEVQANSQEIQGLEQQVAALERDLAATKSELNVALHDLDAATDQNGVLTDQVRDSQRALFIAEDELAKARARITELEAGEPEPEPQRPTLTFGVGIDQLGTIETKAGAPVGYHRTYWTLPSSGVHTSAVAAAKADLAAGRTPVMSFKLPVAADFAGAAAGKYDATIKATVDALAALGGIVVVAIHHEPEDDGTLADFKAMTAHLVDVVKRRTVQFWVGLMGYHQLYGDSEWKLDAVFVPGVDGYGFDPYLSYGASSTKWTDQTTSYYAKFGAWAKKVGVQWGIWETGQNDQAATSGLAQAATFAADCAAGARAYGAAMWIWFNSETTKDGKHNWRLNTLGANKEAQMAAVVVKYAPKES